MDRRNVRSLKFYRLDHLEDAPSNAKGFLSSLRCCVDPALNPDKLPVDVPKQKLGMGLANKCRDMAIKSHPPPFPLGNKAYAQDERDFFRACVAKKGQMPESDAPNPK
jgi:hypothetical protein